MKKYFRVTLKGPHPVVFFDLEVAESVSLPQFWANIALAGCVVTNNFIVVYDQIAHISVVTVEMVRQPWKPEVVS